MMASAEYVGKEILKAVVFLAVLILPGMLAAWGMNCISNSIRRRLHFLGDRTFLYLTAPGVAVHELSHAVFCLIFGHKIIKMNLFSPEEDGTLGYVRHQYNSHNLYQRIGNFFIGTGPIWGGLLLLYLSSRLLLPEDVFLPERDLSDNLSAFLKVFFTLGSWRSVSFYIWLYVSLTISAHITLSYADIKGAKDGFVFLSGIVILSYLLFGWHGTWDDCLVEKLVLVFCRLFSLIAINSAALLLIAFCLGLLPFTRK